MKLIFVVLILGWMGVFCAQAEDEVPPPFEQGVIESASVQSDGYDPFDPDISAPTQIRSQLEYVEMSQKDLTKLMMQEKSTRIDAAALRMKVQEMIDKNSAKIIDTQMIITRSGQKSTSQSEKEIIYPTEFESVSSLPPADGEKEPVEIPKPVGGDFNAVLPTCFESKNLGSSLEVEPTLGEDPKIIDVRIISKYSWYTGNTIWHEAKSAGKDLSKIITPDFYAVSIDTTVTTVSGQYFLIGILSPKDTNNQADPERKMMVFLKCDVLTAVQ